MNPVTRSSVPALVLVGAALLLPACGGSADDEARRVQTTSVIAKNDPVKKYLVTQAEIEHEASGGVRRAFLEYWSALQFQGWNEAAKTFEPGLRRYVGTDALIRALANQGGSYRSSRPDIQYTTTRGNSALIRYFRVGADAPVATSISWTREGSGRWLISYDPLLDQALGDARQLEVQQNTDPLAQKPSAAAVRAGTRARRLQSQYVAQRERTAAGQP
jgi:hypothetical protein